MIKKVITKGKNTLFSHSESGVTLDFHEGNFFFFEKKFFLVKFFLRQNDHLPPSRQDCRANKQNWDLILTENLS